MTSTQGWTRPDWQSMSGEELRNHLEKMKKIGEAYLDLYAGGEWPISKERWQAWWDRTTPEFRVYFSHLPPDTDLPVHDMIASLPVRPENDTSMKAARQEDVHIHPFPGGCLFEQVSVMTRPDGVEIKTPGVHVFYLNDEGKVVRSHEYYNMAPQGAGAADGLLASLGDLSNDHAKG